MPGLGIWIVVGPKGDEVGRCLERLSDAGATVTEANPALRTTRGGTAVELSPRQREVLGLLAHGLSNKEIASTLHLAPSTIANLVSSLLSQTGAHNRAELASLAALSGIANEPGPMAC